MSKTQDAYSNGVYVSLTCLQCPMVAITPNRSAATCPLAMSDQWKEAHEYYHPRHKVARFIHYVA